MVSCGPGSGNGLVEDFFCGDPYAQLAVVLILFLLIALVYGIRMSGR